MVAMGGESEIATGNANLDRQGNSLQGREPPPTPGGLKWKYHQVRSVKFPDHWKLLEERGPFRRWFEPVVLEHFLHDHNFLSRWNARKHRKGRLPHLRLTKEDKERRTLVRERRWTFLAPFGWHLIGWEPGKIAYWNAVFFTVGSIFWVINASLAMWPLANESVNTYVAGYTGFAGGLCFWIGSYAGVLEVVNRPRKAALGWEVEHDVEARSSIIRHPKTLQRKKKAHRKTKVSGERQAPNEQPTPLGSHEMQTLPPNENTAGVSEGREVRIRDGAALDGLEEAWEPLEGHRGGGAEGSEKGGGCTRSGADGEEAEEEGAERFRWWGWEPHNFSYATAFTQLVGASIFSISANVTALPHVLPSGYPPRGWQLYDILSWTPQCVGALFFIANGFMAIVEAEGSWLSFHPLHLGWEIGFWNILGGVGFFFSGFFFYFQYPVHCCVYWGANFSTYWGSWFFLISSYLLLVEVLN